MIVIIIINSKRNKNVKVHKAIKQEIEKNAENESLSSLPFGPLEAGVELKLQSSPEQLNFCYFPHRRMVQMHLEHLIQPRAKAVG